MDAVDLVDGHVERVPIAAGSLQELNPRIFDHCGRQVTHQPVPVLRVDSQPLRGQGKELRVHDGDGRVDGGLMRRRRGWEHVPGGLGRGVRRRVRGESERVGGAHLPRGRGGNRGCQRQWGRRVRRPLPLNELVLRVLRPRSRSSGRGWRR